MLFSRALSSGCVAPHSEMPTAGADYERLFALQATLERKRVQQLQDRISAVQNRIKQMTGSNKAITIFARTQYPAAEVAKFGTYTTLLDGMDYPALNEPLDSELAPPDASPLVMSQLSPDDEVGLRRSCAQLRHVRLDFTPRF